MYCEKCGNKLMEDARFCAVCGAPIPTHLQGRGTDRICPVCGRTVPWNFAGCVCGYPYRINPSFKTVQGVIEDTHIQQPPEQPIFIREPQLDGKTIEPEQSTYDQESGIRLDSKQPEYVLDATVEQKTVQPSDVCETPTEQESDQSVFVHEFSAEQEVEQPIYVQKTQVSEEPVQPSFVWYDSSDGFTEEVRTPEFSDVPVPEVRENQLSDSESYQKDLYSSADVAENTDVSNVSNVVVTPPTYGSYTYKTIDRQTVPASGMYTKLGGFLMLIVGINSVVAVLHLVELMVYYYADYVMLSHVSTVRDSLQSGMMACIYYVAFVPLLTLVFEIFMDIMVSIGIIRKNPSFLKTYQIYCIIAIGINFISIVSGMVWLKSYDIYGVVKNDTEITKLVGVLIYYGGLSIFGLRHYFANSTRARMYMGSDKYLRSSLFNKDSNPSVLNAEEIETIKNQLVYVPGNDRTCPACGRKIAGYSSGCICGFSFAKEELNKNNVSMGSMSSESDQEMTAAESESVTAANIDESLASVQQKDDLNSNVNDDSFVNSEEWKKTEKLFGDKNAPWICNKCGTENPGENGTCSFCGNFKIMQSVFFSGKVVKTSSAEDHLFCTGCGKQLAADERFCERCGTPAENPDNGRIRSVIANRFPYIPGEEEKDRGAEIIKSYRLPEYDLPGHPYKRLGGFLLYIVIISFVSAAFWFALDIKDTVDLVEFLDYFGGWLPKDFKSWFVTLMVAGTAGSVLNSIMQIIFAVKIIRRNRGFLKFYKAVFVCSIVFIIVYVLIILGWGNSIGLDFTDTKEEIIKMSLWMVYTIISFAMYVYYFNHSMRVRIYMGTDAYL